MLVNSSWVIKVIELPYCYHHNISYDAMIKAMFNGAENYLAEKYSLYFFSMLILIVVNTRFFNYKQICSLYQLCKSGLRKTLTN